MASINGVQIKSLKSYRGHEWEHCYQGNVYLNGKKLGFWSQDSWGGPDRYEFNESLLDEAVENYKAGCTSKYKDLTNADILLSKLVSLADLEKSFKKSQYDTMIYMTNSFLGSYIMVNKTEDVLKTYKKYVDKAIDEMKQQMNEEVAVHILDKDSFDIVVDAEHEEPLFL